MSWPILLTVIAVSFGLGAFWHSKHAADVRRRHGDRIEVPYPLPVQTFDSSTEYRMGRRATERIAR
jgi:hypothetical protein